VALLPLFLSWSVFWNLSGGLSPSHLPVLVMDLISLEPLLDFDVGKIFEHELCRSLGKAVHDSSSGGRFLLLATFKRYLFQLNEFSVAVALQSCLGGSAAAFQVSCQSHNHYRFSVSCKDVGFAIYKLRRFIGRSFDVYFHLWSNGAPHWEREKRLWEEEEAKRWSLVVSRQQKRARKNLPVKRVRFAEKLIQSPPVHISKASESQNFVKIGSVMVNLSKGFDQVSGNGFVPGSLKFLSSTSSLELSEDRPVQSSSSPCKSSFS
jgi:hypothetical protein